MFSLLPVIYRQVVWWPGLACGEIVEVKAYRGPEELTRLWRQAHEANGNDVRARWCGLRLFRLRDVLPVQRREQRPGYSSCNSGARARTS